MGVTSFFSDAGHEMATALLPTLLGAIGATPAALCAVEGVSDAASSAIKLLSGWYTDRVGRRKPAAVAGYLLTAVKGLHALLAAAVPGRFYGRAFGFHRAMDTAGAVVGPLLASGLLLGLVTALP
jgi:MFS family permease